VPAAQALLPRRDGMQKRFKRVSKLAGVAAVVLLVLYPLAAYLSLRSLRPGWLAGLLIVASLTRLIAARASGAPITPQLLLVPLGGIALALWSLLRAAPAAMLYYPALCNGVLLCVFAYSVVFPPTVVERIARLKDGPLSPAAQRYTRSVTIAWIAFFVVNGGIAVYTAQRTSLDTWALYNGFIAYLLIGAMFGGEWLVRSRVLAAQRKLSSGH
jgi:uncharacterized membrane protein